ncbi:MAG: ABC-type Fe3+-hydroxamate transport system substrate-binding protein [Bacteroidia bacterium]|jgi:ABC-type Fe3+-hydroxamate transport system substrate-binding protein
MISVKDQLGNTIRLERPATRVVSLVPSQTELLYYLGVVPIGQTVFCIHPSETFKESIKIGGTKKLQIDKIKSLNPDLIIGNKEENVQDQIQELRQDYPVYMSDVNTLEDAYKMIEQVGQITGKKIESDQLGIDVVAQFNRLITPSSVRPSVLYLIWNDPYFGVGRRTFIHDLLEIGGFTNALKDRERYPELSPEQVATINPDYIFLSSEPFPFSEEHKKAVQLQFPESKVVLVDGEMFSWYGSRLLQTPEYINRLISDIGGYEPKS